ncbi:hypothetical protein OEZ85_001895 [Tetradesmus obliquus]|uniref:Galactose oxidase-like Early set domain-containing protein n=1 Tax=Tetradesmus obliquus TaxID=3088 RepID=A0ABY8U198_TETOB|nr:hypothetical protein OEZ85_001895 [Tetradesmus obliquus]
MASYPVPDDAAKAVSGYYEPLGQAPVAVAHALQLPCGNKFLVMEFGPTGKEGQLMLPHPSTNPEGFNIMQVYDRDDETWTNIPTSVNSVCGGWARLSNGQVGLFAGHYGTLQAKQVEGFKSVFVFDPTSLRLTPKANLTRKRWYPTTVTLPNGDIYVPGGTKPQMTNGVWPKAEAADIFNHAHDTVTQVPTNSKLHEAGLGNWYLGALVLPTGQLAVMNKNMMQVINPYTGEALAEAPALPDKVKDLVWEFPRMGPQVHLRAPVMKPGKDVRLEFVAFGGSWVDLKLDEDLKHCSHVGCNRVASEKKPCADVAVRIGLKVTAGGQYKFDDSWEVETMPGQRCIFDGILLPNGHVVLIGGQKVGLGDLTDSPAYNGGHQPYNEPWIYKPDQPNGKRFTKTGAKTKIARQYHATSILTKDGDILIGGTSNAGFWHSSNEQEFSRTPLGVNEYRMEVYHPPYLFQGNLPRITTPPPTVTPYGSTFEVGYAFHSPAAITAVVLHNAGGVTHNYAIGHRSQQLEFTSKKINATHGTLTVQAPAAPEYAPPAHYNLFLLRGDVYSQSAWVQVRKPLGQVPVDYPQDAQLIPEMGTTFEAGSKQPFKLGLSNGRTATAKFAAPAARGTGAYGARVTVTNGPAAAGTITLHSEAAQLKGGTRCYVQLWARASGKDSTLTAVFFKADAAGTVTEKGQKRLAVFDAGKHTSDGAVVEDQTMHLVEGSYCLNLMGPVEVKDAGSYALQLDLGAAKAGATIDIDDVEVYCV